MKNKAMLMSLLGALLALTSCRDLTLPPVFYTLEKEQPLSDDKGFPDIATVHRIVKTGTRYFAAANKLYTRTDGPSENWTVVAPPVPGALCNNVEVFSGQIYAGFATGSGQGLYRSAPDPISWSQIADLGLGSGPQVTLLKAAGGRLFAATATWSGTTFTYALSHSLSGDSGGYLVISGAGWGATPPNADLPIIDIASDNNFYWVVIGNSVYRDDGAAGVGAFSKLTTPSSGTASFGGVFYNAPTLYLSAGNGLLHSSSDDGDTWPNSSAAIEVSDDPVPFTAFGQIVIGSDIYVGTQGYGYYRIPGGDVTATPVRSPSYNISSLYNGALNCLFYDLAQSRLFLCTSGAGLWRGDYIDGTYWSWKQE
jgi:hypothetical protein